MPALCRRCDALAPDPLAAVCPRCGTRLNDPDAPATSWGRALARAAVLALPFVGLGVVYGVLQDRAARAAEARLWVGMSAADAVAELGYGPTGEFLAGFVPPPDGRLVVARQGGRVLEIQLVEGRVTDIHVGARHAGLGYLQFHHDPPPDPP